MMAKSRTHANRGMQLEKLIDATNKIYRTTGFADVKKVPTPVRITSNNGGRINGMVVKGDLVDFVGVCQGRAVIFDAKQTSTRTSFSLSNVADHQYETLMSWWKQGAHTFILLYFSERGEHYMLDMPTLSTYWQGAQEGGRKSIPYDVIASQCELLQASEGYPLHYLKVLG
ncbi:Holliday junction resolvase RecU [Sporosarcina sp. P12(2017)]|nr:Holliday junction resolvase RecU [Sporosarcina sp. P10]PIC62403.1 Holliday junction resolvase RecU [Sporosarcina sp. P12(2017)]